MKIVVCIKQVPDTTEVRLDPETGTLIRKGIPSIINPDDKAGIEAALRLKDTYGADVTVLTMGPKKAKDALREAQAMGADRGILLSDPAFAGSDTWATSSALAGALRTIDFDLIIAGRQAIDGDTAQVGPQIAEHLGIPSVSYVEEIERSEESLIVKRAFEDGYQRIRLSMPCLITVLKELNQARYMRIGAIYDAWRNDVIEEWTVKDISVEPSHLGLKGSPTKVKSSRSKELKGDGEKHELPPREAARLIADRLRERYVI
jgi:electron transfer flavoprotein beta subunit